MKWKLSGLGILWLFSVLFLLLEWGPFVAPNKILSPTSSLWQPLASPFLHKGERHLEIKGLREAVVVASDKRQIRHIFALSDWDAYVTQGYLLAMDRLWQMEFIKRVASGRLSEVLGESALSVDRFFHHIQIPQAAKRSAKLLMEDRQTASALQAYAVGVNAGIEDLVANGLPFEYRLLKWQPEAWSPEDAAYLLKFMDFQLSTHSRDGPLTRTLGVLGEDLFDLIFPLFTDDALTAPIFQMNTRNQEDQFSRNVPPLFLNLPKKLERTIPGLGSNNWAVSGQKGDNGYSILSNDIHLSLNLPSLWYQLQIHTPDQNVYGVALPGAPGIILGFNEHVSWGVTNGGSDVMDWFELRLREEDNQYLFDGEWRPLVNENITISVREREPEVLTVQRTHMGPVFQENRGSSLGKNYPQQKAAVRWVGHYPSNELKTFLLLNRSRTIDECELALRYFDSPPQNFLCADGQRIGLWHAGRIPRREVGNGHWVMDGTKRSSDWNDFLGRSELPKSVDPKTHHLGSANQPPVAKGGVYLGAQFEMNYRGRRIFERLEEKSFFSVNDFIDMQNDVYSLLFQDLLPVFLIELSPESHERFPDSVGLLNSWDYRFEESSKAASVAKAWFGAIKEKIWKNLPQGNEFAYPTWEQTAALVLNGQLSLWLEPHGQVFKELVNEAFWIIHNKEWPRWGKKRLTHFNHISNLPGLGISNQIVKGHFSTLFANTGSHGPVWRLVVEMADWPKAYAIYPGGQSGDPLSPHYKDFLKDWINGHVYPVSFYSDVHSIQDAWSIVNFLPLVEP